jgi:hypothetical protein
LKAGKLISAEATQIVTVKKWMIALMKNLIFRKKLNSLFSLIDPTRV